MSNKPKIYGTCAAGCLWETVHKEDFEKSASIMEIPRNEDGTFTLETYKSYRVEAPSSGGSGDWGFNLTVTFMYYKYGGGQATVDYSILLPHKYRYDDFLEVSLLGIECREYTDQEYGHIVLYVELDGEKKEILTDYRCNTTGLTNKEIKYATISNGAYNTQAKACYVINEDATVEAEAGDSVFIRYSANADGTDFTKAWEEGQNYIGIATGKIEPTDKSGYTWGVFASKPQMHPLFANDISECTDTTKAYILPDGYIYAYMLTKNVVGGYTNKAEPLPDNTTDTTKWVNGYRLSSSGASAQSGKTISNPVSVKKGDVIRVKGVDFDSQDRFELYGKNSSGETVKQRAYVSVLPNVMLGYELVDGVHTFTVVYENITTDGYIRFAFTTPTDASAVIITVNEEITEPQIVKEYAWCNTGHAFVPADYEDRILALEDTAEEQAESIDALNERIADIEDNAETEANTDIPTHWQNAIETAKTKIANIQSKGGVNCANFVWASDIHASVGIDEKGKRFGIVAKAIMDESDIPLFVGTGDLMSQSSHASVTNVYNELALVRKWLEPIPYERQALIMGNHDGAWGDTTSGYYYKQLPLEVMYNLIYRKQAMDFRRVSGENGTYYYIDNVSQKVRFIMLNTNNTPSDENYNNDDGTAKYDRFHTSCLCQEQYDWFTNIALDMPDGYTACVFMHEPYVGGWELMVGIVDAYNNKGAFSNTFTDSDNAWRNSTISVNFSNVNGEIAGVFAGHTHESVMRYAGNNPMYSTCPLITIANAVGGEVRDGTTRTDGTASEFAMDIVTIDTKNRKIYMTRLGAGSDREIDY